MPAVSSPPPAIDDEAEEHDSPPNDEDISDLTSVAGYECGSDESRSSDGDDSGRSVKAFVRDDRLPSPSQPSSEPSLASEKDEAVFAQHTQQTQESTSDARAEQLRAWYKPNGAWRPPCGGSASPPSSPSPNPSLKRSRPDEDRDRGVTDDESDEGYVHRPTRRARTETRDPRKKGKARRRSRSLTTEYGVTTNRGGHVSAENLSKGLSY
ncbi:hypothetical protein CF326_g8889 [Tilletia indica]|nr:hypothetical protein CF326_g8889 [Tilletia indica]